MLSMCALRICNLNFIGHFDQIAIRVPKIKRQQGATGSGSLHGACDDFNTATLNMIHRIVKRSGGDKTQIRRSGSWEQRFRFEFISELVKVDFLGAELQRDPAIAEYFAGHSQDRFVKRYCGGNILHGEDQMIKLLYLHGIGL